MLSSVLHSKASDSRQRRDNARVCSPAQMMVDQQQFCAQAGRDRKQASRTRPEHQGRLRRHPPVDGDAQAKTRPQDRIPVREPWSLPTERKHQEPGAKARPNLEG